MTINEIQDQIIQELSQIHDWLDKYNYLIGLGKQQPIHGNQFRTDENSIASCQSDVWISAELKDEKIHFKADSDSLILRGLLTLLIRVLNNQPPESVAFADLYFLAETDLITHLSPSRVNGLRSIIKILKSYAAKYSANNGCP